MADRLRSLGGAIAFGVFLLGAARAAWKIATILGGIGLLLAWAEWSESELEGR